MKNRVFSKNRQATAPVKESVKIMSEEKTEAKSTVQSVKELEVKEMKQKADANAKAEASVKEAKKASDPYVVSAGHSLICVQGVKVPGDVVTADCFSRSGNAEVGESELKRHLERGRICLKSHFAASVGKVADARKAALEARKKRAEAKNKKS